MKFLFFNYWNVSRELEWNLLWTFGTGPRFCEEGFDSSKRTEWSFRFGTHQLALWKNGKAIFDLTLQQRTEAQSIRRHGG